MSVIDKLLYKMFGTPHARKVKRLQPTLMAVTAKHLECQKLNDTELAAKSDEFKERLKNGESLEDIKVEAFAVSQEACDRRLGIFNVFDAQHGFDFSKLTEPRQREAEAAKESLASETPEWEIHLSAEFYAEIREMYPESVKPFRMMPFPVQIVGGLILHEGAIAEMATGEGKTLAAACPVYLNALSGDGVHVVTVNDYLAGRDARNMGRVYKFLGLKVGLIIHGLNSDQRRESYNADVIYGTNNEFGFDYLRDNMAVQKEDLVQRVLNYCIVDEVDSILIDEARTPLIISGAAEDATDKYQKANALVKRLKRDEDYTIDEKHKNVQITEKGVGQIETTMGFTGLYGEQASWVHYILQAIKAHNVFVKDVDYIVREGEIVIVDENTGRLMEGRRYSEGIHQSIEAKENVQIRRENQTLATITFQNLFRMYKKLSGMTGTAETEATEFLKIYNMPTWVIPTHKPCIRYDMNDQIYKTADAKWKAIIADIKDRNTKGQPILVGTISVEKSEKLSKMLRIEGIPHDVLNAKNHGREAEIILFAGHKGKVTVATNMAGRGTDIALGPGVVELGGLHVLGTERHESRRIDNQLRGRSGRQGDPGSSQYYLSLDDDLMRVFGGDNVRKVMDRFGFKDDDVIEHPWITKSVRNAQKRIESQNFDARKHLLDYDNVMNEQRKVIYSLRRSILMGEDIKGEITNRIEDAADIKVSKYVVANSYPEAWDMEGLETDLKRSMGFEYRPESEHLVGMTADQVLDEVIKLYKERYEKIEKMLPPEELSRFERTVLLHCIDGQWKEHLYGMDHLREATRFHGYAQRDPLIVYKNEGFKMFQECLETIASNTVMGILNVRVEVNGQTIPLAMAPSPQRPTMTFENRNAQGEAVQPMGSRAAINRGPAAQKPVQVVKQAPKVGRNDPCPCGSGKKHKQCCG
ncbi:MAG: preprotein translocase subunit SecA [Fibromonadaceae bacterium]|jgi:preprotein translocase subunit SecA|nr:preprotein translocase subunit SecA [Fibromonadaceae bacterium]